MKEPRGGDMVVEKSGEVTRSRAWFGVEVL